jgi:threonine synthase
MMRFRSTRDEQLTAGFGEALAQGLAPDGGLYVPTEWPRVQAGSFGMRESLAGIGAKLLAPFVAGDPLEQSLADITREAFDFPAPIVALGSTGRLAVLELFHGPTAAFKDFGARFLAACLARVRGQASRPLTILVATSGDTGGAVAAAFHGRPGIEVAVL